MSPKPSNPQASAPTALALAQQLKARFAELVSAPVEFRGELTLKVADVERLPEICAFAKNELGFDYLDAPPVVVGARNWITPAHELEQAFFPQPEWIIDAIHEKIMPIKGYAARNNFTANEQMRISRLGI